jgi:lipopolysaccharide/colanic/teichoic acid biosynthesis glycosyltransferase
MVLRPSIPHRTSPIAPRIGGLPDLPLDHVPRRRLSARVLDVVIAGVAVFVLAPGMALVAAVIKCTSRGPALFRQIRLGHGGRPFAMYKFRTMYVDCDDRIHREYVQRLLQDPAVAPSGPEGLYKLVDDPRITPVGRWLRRWSVDELPQLYNVLRGEMALVGPRPVLPWEAALFSPRHAVRFQVPPGITGLWQTNGRNRLTMSEALDLDVAYVQAQCLRLDITILLRTVPVVFGREGVR